MGRATSSHFELGALKKIGELILREVAGLDFAANGLQDFVERRSREVPGENFGGVGFRCLSGGRCALAKPRFDLGCDRYA